MTALPCLDAAWRAANPLPVHGADTTKDSRGTVLLVGGSRLVPGALRLTGEATLRAGAGKLQIATIESAAQAIGLFVPEAAVIGLAEDALGDIDADHLDPLIDARQAADTVIVGPAIERSETARRIVTWLAQTARADTALVLDAAAVPGSAGLGALLNDQPGNIVMTPHHGEMAGLMGCDVDAVRQDPPGIARRAAADFGAVVALKGSDTVIASPDGEALFYPGGGVGLATGGSGDVLAGIVGGLLARGAAPMAAAGWAVWLHGEAGRTLALTTGPVGFLARDLPRLIPGLLPR